MPGRSPDRQVPVRDGVPSGRLRPTAKGRPIPDSVPAASQLPSGETASATTGPAEAGSETIAAAACKSRRPLRRIERRAPDGPPPDHRCTRDPPQGAKRMLLACAAAASSAATVRPSAASKTCRLPSAPRPSSQRPSGLNASCCSRRRHRHRVAARILAVELPERVARPARCRSGGVPRAAASGHSSDSRAPLRSGRSEPRCDAAPAHRGWPENGPSHSRAPCRALPTQWPRPALHGANAAGHHFCIR